MRTRLALVIVPALAVTLPFTACANLADCVNFATGFARLAAFQAGLANDDGSLTDADILGYFGHFYEFVIDDEEVTFNPEYASETVRRFFDVGSPHAHVTKASNVPPSMVITQRINLGLHAVLGRLGATANFRRIAEELWPMVDGPPSTPMGEAEATWLETVAHR